MNGTKPSTPEAAITNGDATDDVNRYYALSGNRGVDWIFDYMYIGASDIGDVEQVTTTTEEKKHAYNGNNGYSNYLK